MLRRLVNLSRGTRIRRNLLVRPPGRVIHPGGRVTQRRRYQAARARLSTVYNPVRTAAVRRRYQQRRAFLSATRGAYIGGRYVPHIIQRINRYL